MSAPEDRILELALDEVVGGRRPPDLEIPILARVRRRATAYRFGWAAAALVVVGLGVLLGKSALVGAPRAPDATLWTEAEKEAAEDWLAIQLQSTVGIRPSTPEGLQHYKRMRSGRDRLLDLLDEKPSGWPRVRERLLPLPEEVKALDIRMRSLRILGRDPDLESQALVLRELESRNYAVDEATLLVLAERGRVVAETALADRMAADPAAPPFALPGVYFALRGDARGRASLEFVIASPALWKALPGTGLASAAGLRRLDDDRPWTVVVEALRARVEETVEAGALDEARRIIAAFELVMPMLDGATIVPVGDLDRRAARRGRALADELPSEASIRARIDELLRR